MTSLPNQTAAPRSGPSPARRLLSRTGAAWFIAALCGQALFAVYILLAYGLSAARGDWAFWTANLVNGILDSDPFGNALVVLHLLLAFVITASGPLQLIPSLRRHMPGFHRWNGRIYLLVAVIISLGGIAMSVTRPAFGGPVNAVLQSFNAVTILFCAALAWRFALARNLAAHRRWATRLFLAASGVWFLRIMMISWAIPTGGAGLGGELDGPAGRFLMLGQTVIPLAVYQLYLMAEGSRSGLAQSAMAAALVLLTLIMSAGIVGVTFAMWLPVIESQAAAGTGPR